MKIFTVFLVSVILLLSGKVQAQGQIFTSDSVSASIILGSLSMNFEQNALGKPDNRQATFGSTGLLILGFGAGTKRASFNAGSKINIYFRKENFDSSDARVQFLNVDENLYTRAYGPKIFVSGAGNINEAQVVTLTVPADGFNALQFEVASDTGATTFFLDAVTLLQHVVLGVPQYAHDPISLQGYPNPFSAASGASLRFTLPEAGATTIEVRNMLGREVLELPLGHITSGSQEVSLPLHEQGIFIARVKVDGNYIGAPLKLSAE